MASLRRISISHFISNFKWCRSRRLILGIRRRERGPVSAPDFCLLRTRGSRRMEKIQGPGVSAHSTKASRRLQAPRPFLKLGLNGPFFTKKKFIVVFTLPGHILSRKRMVKIGPEMGKLAMMRHQAPRPWYAPRPVSAHTLPTLTRSNLCPHANANLCQLPPSESRATLRRA